MHASNDPANAVVQQIGVWPAADEQLDFEEVPVLVAVR
jgi:hypothetical protein